MVKLAGEAVQNKLKAHYAILHIMSASCLESIADFNRNNFILTWQHGVRTWQMQSELGLKRLVDIVDNVDNKKLSTNILVVE